MFYVAYKSSSQSNRSVRYWVACLLVLVGAFNSARASAEHQSLPPVEARKPDSLYQLLQLATKPDTVRINRLNALGLALRLDKAPQAFRMFNSALALAQQLHYLRGAADAQFGLGYHYRATTDYDSALYYTQRAVQGYAKLRDTHKQGQGLYNVARIYFEQGNYSRALAANLEGLTLMQKHHDRQGELFQIIQLGVIYRVLGDYATSRQQLMKALLLSYSLHDTIGVGHTYNALGDLSRALYHWNAASYYYDKAAVSYRRVYSQIAMVPTELNLAEMLERQHKYIAALKMTSGLLKRTQAVHYTGQISRAQLLLARTYLAIGQLDSASAYGTKCLAINQHNGRRQEACDAAEVLVQTSAKLHHWAEAYHYQQLLITYNQRLNGEATRRQTTALQLAYGRRQQQTQIKLLRQQARLQTQQHELERLRYHQQLLLIAGLALLVLTLGGALLWHFRRREAHRIEALRTRIASDLHDEVGSMLTQIAMQSTLLREGRHAPTQQQTYLNQMSEASRRAARQMSDAVWSIDARYDSVASLLDRLRDHAHEVLPPAGLELDFQADASLIATTLSLATRQALYTIYKEALHNVVKHAQAQQVQVRLRLLPRQLELTVRDDGCGPSEPSRSGGLGLRNMRMRAAAVGGSITFGSAEPGTLLLVRLPLRGK